MEECCGTCKYHGYEHTSKGFVCSNEESEYYSDWTEYEDKCEDWSEKDEDR